MPFAWSLRGLGWLDRRPRAFQFSDIVKTSRKFPERLKASDCNMNCITEGQFAIDWSVDLLPCPFFPLSYQLWYNVSWSRDKSPFIRIWTQPPMVFFAIFLPEITVSRSRSAVSKDSVPSGSLQRKSFGHVFPSPYQVQHSWDHSRSFVVRYLMRKESFAKIYLCSSFDLVVIISPPSIL